MRSLESTVTSFLANELPKAIKEIELNEQLKGRFGSDQIELYLNEDKKRSEHWCQETLCDAYLCKNATSEKVYKKIKETLKIPLPSL